MSVSRLTARTTTSKIIILKEANTGGENIQRERYNTNDDDEGGRKPNYREKYI
jgi:hypothetical protein